MTHPSNARRSHINVADSITKAIGSADARDPEELAYLRDRILDALESAQDDGHDGALFHMLVIWVVTLVVLGSGLVMFVMLRGG